MVKKNKNKGKGKAKVESASISSIKQASSSSSAGKLMYTGPIMLPKTILQEDVHCENLFFEGTLTSSSTGVINNFYTNDPTNCLEWTTWVLLYEEFRVLAFELEYFPSNRYSKTTTVCIPGVGVVDKTGSGALSSLSNGFSHGSCRVLSLEDPWTSRRDFAGNKAPSFTWRMSSAEEALFTNTSTTLSNGAIKLFFANLSNSTQYGIILLRFLVQFRGRF